MAKFKNGRSKHVPGRPYIPSQKEWAHTMRIMQTRAETQVKSATYARIKRARQLVSQAYRLGITIHTRRIDKLLGMAISFS